MKNLHRQILVISTVLLLTSCFTRSNPTYDLLYSYDPDAPETWKLGWQHGCESGYTAYGTNIYGSMYTFKQDVTRINDQYYYKAWNDAFNICRAYINRYTGGDSKVRKNPAVFTSDDLRITNTGLRDDAPITKTGLFSGTSGTGLFGDAFDLQTPGYGSTAWGANVDECDWLNRCGSDKPKDPIDALLGH